MSNLSRRSLVASAASLPALAVPAVAVAVAASAEPDPIYAAIEEHRNALLRRFEKGIVTCVLHPRDANHDIAREEDDPLTKGLRDRSVHRLDEALGATRKAIRDVGRPA